MSAPRVDEERIARDIEAIAACSETDPSVGYSRPTFSSSWRRARDYVLARAAEAGASAWIDAAGNAHARATGLEAGRRAWLCGSHIDSVPTGGKFDGVVGVVVALEVLRTAPGAPVELIVFAEEEGTTFSLGMVGSRAWAGSLPPEKLRLLRNAEGRDYLAAGAEHGVAAERLSAERLEPGKYLGLIEAHVEQGPGMWNAGTPIAVVTAIAGRRQYACTLTGEANHAGATRMKDRKDALAGAAEGIGALEAWARDMEAEQGATVLTVGRIEVQPNSVNVIPGRASFMIDFRARSDDTLTRGDLALRGIVAGIASRRGLGCDLVCNEDLPAVRLDPGLCSLLRDAARRQGVEAQDAVSGALHDTAILAPYLPAAMIFVASRGGISHNPAEFSRIEDVASAARIVAEAVRE